MVVCVEESSQGLGAFKREHGLNGVCCLVCLQPAYLPAGQPSPSLPCLFGGRGVSFLACLAFLA